MKIVEHVVGRLQLVDLVGTLHGIRRVEREAVDTVVFDGVPHFGG